MDGPTHADETNETDVTGETRGTDGPGGALQVTLDLWYPDCWEIETTERLDVGLLGYGIYTTGEWVTTLFTAYADDRAAIDEAVETIAGFEQVHAVSEVDSTYRYATVPAPGNAMRDLLVDHDGRMQISGALMSRGFVPAEPIDIRAGREHWTLVTSHDRESVRAKLETVEDEWAAEIRVRGITCSNWQTTVSGLPTDRLTKRQLEVFRLARERGYYEWPKETSAGDLAAELGISTSTLHEHLHKAEAALLGRDGTR
jgi:predicted DNA binding protein